MIIIFYTAATCMGSTEEDETANRVDPDQTASLRSSLI